MAFSFNPLRTIRAQIFLGFVAMGVLTGALGGYGIYAASRANRIVVDIYDRPLTAHNFARSASATFRQKENQLQARLAGHEPSTPVSLDHLADSFFGDLAIARQRSMSSGAARSAVDIQGLVQEWLAAALAATPDGDPPDLNMLSARVLKAFDQLIELTAEDGFRERQRSLAELRATMLVSTGCTILALLAAGLITFVLARRILRPLSAAATVADRIAQGELAVEIPPGRLDEIGRLLRSMHSMQTNIRTMMDEEAEQRRSAQRRLVDAIEGAHEGVMLVGADGRIVIANSQARRFLPLAGDELQPGTSFDAIMARAVPSGMASTANGADGDPAMLLSTEGEVRLGGRLWLKISRGLTRDGGFFLFWSDISDIKERELRLHEAKAEAEAASRSKSIFLANMSHELRTPLNAIIGFSEIMAGKLYGALGDPRYEEYAGLISRSGRHLLDIISTILDFAKCEAGQTVLHRELLDLREIGKSCVAMVGRECASNGIALSLDLPAVPAIVEGDAPKLRQMLLNLLSNAMKFTPAGGAVRVAVSAGGAARASLSVSDTGIGMKPDDIPVALAPFGQIDAGLSRSYEGTGLGLPLTKAFAELHNAAFEIVSEPGEGTTVTLRFPAVAAERPSIARSSPRHQP